MSNLNSAGDIFHVVLVAALISLGMFCGQTVGTELGSGEYLLPLTERYAVHREDLDLPEASTGRYRLVEVTNTRAPWSWSPVIENVKRTAVSGEMIVGTAKEGYFTLDTSRTGKEPETRPVFYTDVRDWHEALQAAGVAGDISLNDPDKLAATMSDRQLHPTDYRLLKGLLGRSDPDWAGLIQLAGLSFILLLGFKCRSSVLLFFSAAAVGVLVDFLSEIILLGGGPGAFVGLVLFPLIYWLVGGFGRLVGKRVWKRPALNTTATLAR